MQLSAFGWLDTQLTTTVNAVLAQVVTNNITAAAHILVPVATIAVAVGGYLVVTGRLVIPNAAEWFFRVAFVGAILSGANYTTYVVQVFQHALPDFVAQSITGNPQANVANQLDVVANTFWSAIGTAWKSLGWSFQAIPEGLALLGTAAFVGLALCLGFLFLYASQLIVVALIAVGPLLIPLYLFQHTRSFAERWIHSLLSSMVFYGMTLLVLQVGTQVAVRIVQNAVGNMSGGVAGDILTFIAQLIGLSLDIVACFAFLLFVPSLANRLSSGVHTMPSLVMTGRAGAGAARAAMGVGGAAASGVRAVTRMVTPGRPVGKS